MAGGSGADTRGLNCRRTRRPGSPSFVTESFEAFKLAQGGQLGHSNAGRDTALRHEPLHFDECFSRSGAPRPSRPLTAPRKLRDQSPRTYARRPASVGGTRRTARGLRGSSALMFGYSARRTPAPLGVSGAAFTTRENATGGCWFNAACCEQKPQSIRPGPSPHMA
jgi:hypothetical protein